MKFYSCDFYVLVFCGFSVAFTYDDLSYKKVASQSSTLTGNYNDAKNAVDRNVATCMKTDDIGGSSPRGTVWWKVDLGRIYNINSVNILFKNYISDEYRQRGRFAGFSLYVSTTGDIQGSTQCYKDGPLLPPLNFTTPCIEYGRYLFFYNERLYGLFYPQGYELSNVFTELCEVIVEECKEGWYGVNCSQKCIGHCRDGNSCTHVTGQCDGGCAPGWTGSLCHEECNDGTYGFDCVNNCSGHCLNGFSCNKQTGHCDNGCDPGYIDNDCSKECSFGYFGLDCRKRCSGHCKNNVACDHVSGECPSGCIDGYIGRHCYMSCQPGYYGANCFLACAPNCMTCRQTDGLCSCKAGWMGHNCTTECSQSYGENCQYPCSIHCMNQTCDRFNGNCLCDGKLDRMQDVETNDVSSSTLWIVAFCISMENIFETEIHNRKSHFFLAVRI